jgi:hypothetical protein
MNPDRADNAQITKILKKIGGLREIHMERQLLLTGLIDHNVNKIKVTNLCIVNKKSEIRSVSRTYK